MEFEQLLRRAMEVRQQYAALEACQYGRAWSREEVLQGFVVDVGDLVKLSMASQGIRDVANAESKLAHELADCLWSVLVLSELYGVDLEREFVQTMNELERRVRGKLLLCHENNSQATSPPHTG